MSDFIGVFMYAYAPTHFPRPRPSAIVAIEYTQIDDLAVQAYVTRMTAILQRLLVEKEITVEGNMTTTRYRRRDLRTLDLGTAFADPRIMPVLEKVVQVDGPDEAWITVRRANGRGTRAYGIWIASLGLLEL